MHILSEVSCVHLALLCVIQYTTFTVSSYTDSKDTIGSQILKKGSCDPDHAHYGVVSLLSHG